MSIASALGIRKTKLSTRRPGLDPESAFTG